LHYIWKTKNFNALELISTAGKPIRLSNWGNHNHDAGPDFLDGMMEYDGITWAGHIEIHVKSSDWYKHHHQVDPAYDQVILHVVWEDDRPVKDIHLVPIPTLVMSDLVDPALIDRSKDLVQSRYRLPCANHIGGISTFWLNAWKERQLIERLEFRTIKLMLRLEEVNGDWEQVAFELLFRSMGFHANSDALEALAQDISWQLVRKHVHDENNLQAILFGRAGMLDEKLTGKYPDKLKTTYGFLKNKHKLSSHVFIKWNLKGARPANFPTIRIAQLASLLFNKTSLMRNIIEAESVDQLKVMFELNVHEFWNTHYVFHKSVDQTRIGLSASSVRLLIINYCIPLIYASGYIKQDEMLKERAIRFLYEMPTEKNSVLSEFKSAGVLCRSAAESQALLHTFKVYCAPKRCLECQVGAKVVSD